MWIDLEAGDEERARAAREWAIEFLGEKVANGTASDFDRNLYVASAGSRVTDRTMGTLAYLPIAHARYLEKEIELAERNRGRVEEFLPAAVGDRVELTLKVMSVFEHDGHYGTTWITTFRDEAGRTVKWFGSRELERGATVTATWTIKGHEDHVKYGKQTMVTRPSKLTVHEEVAA
jgi:hypothetical protein